MRRRFFFTTNPDAGLSGSPLADAVARVLHRAGAEVMRAHPESVEAARAGVRQAVASRRYDAIVACGGDGTIRQVAACLVGTEVALGIVPGGTANVLAHEMQLPSTPEAIGRALLDGRETDVVCARVNGEPFLLMTGVGFDARVISALNHRFKSLVGKAAYAGPVLGAIVRPMDVLTVTVDGHAHQASWAVVTNARHYGGRFVLTPRTGVQRRGLQTVLFKAKSRAVLIGQLLSLASGTLDARCANRGDVESLSCSHVTIACHRPVPAQVDGDGFGFTPLWIDQGDTHLRLIVPANHVASQAR
jgi:diacylglycerol kinase family enzyme